MRLMWCLCRQEYKHIGRVIGRFYTEAGDRTLELDRVEAVAAEVVASSPQKAKRTAHTACNMQWSVKKGGHRLTAPQGEAGICGEEA